MGWTVGGTNGQTNELIEGWTDRWTDGRTDGRTNRRTDGRTDGRTEHHNDLWGRVHATENTAGEKNFGIGEKRKEARIDFGYLTDDGESLSIY